MLHINLLRTTEWAPRAQTDWFLSAEKGLEQEDVWKPAGLEAPGWISHTSSQDLGSTVTQKR